MVSYEAAILSWCSDTWRQEPVSIEEWVVDETFAQVFIRLKNSVLIANFIVDINGDLSCQTNPSCRIPFTLQAAYANRGSNNTNQAIIMSVAANIASAQFPIRYRGNVPPGPPPTPVYEGFNPNLFQETAYLYIYGFVNVGSIDAGSYTSNVTISISYD